jgi:SAM-dependent methyltransferase
MTYDTIEETHQQQMTVARVSDDIVNGQIFPGGRVDASFILLNLLDKTQYHDILDIGAGAGFWGWLSRAKWGTSPQVWGIDIDPDAAHSLREIGLYNKVLELDLLNCIYKFNDDAFDLIFFTHTIEHLEKKDAVAILEELKRICRGLIIVSCPEGDALTQNPHNIKHEHIHKSIWTAPDFRAQEYNAKSVRFSYRAGRVTSLFEKYWFRLKRLKRGGVVVAWWKNHSAHAQSVE